MKPAWAMEVVPDSEVVLDSVESEEAALHSVESEEVALDSIKSEEMAPDSVMKLPLAMEMAPQDLEQESTTPQELELDSSAQQDFVPDSLLPESQPPPCVRCGTTHDYNDIEACRLARRLANRCARCGLVHSDYNLFARIMDDLDKFDCETYIPYVEKLQMDGNTILVPEHVLKKLEELKKK